MLDLPWRCPDARAWEELVREPSGLRLVCMLKHLASWEGQEGLVASREMNGVEMGTISEGELSPSWRLENSWAVRADGGLGGGRGGLSSTDVPSGRIWGGRTVCGLGAGVVR